MQNNMKKIVSFPIEVPVGPHCCQNSMPYEICSYYDSEGGHSTCDLGFYDLEDTKEGVLKADKCAEFDDVD